jgi:hypothetical protein
MGAHAYNVRTNPEAMLSGAAHLQNLGVSFLSIQLHHRTSEKVTATIFGGKAGVHRRRGFWRRRQDA